MHFPMGPRLARSVIIAFAGLIGLIAVFACGGAVYQSDALRHDRRLNPIPGQLVDVNGYRTSFARGGLANRYS